MHGVLGLGLWIGDLFVVSMRVEGWYRVRQISTLGLEGCSEENMMSRGIQVVRVDEDEMLCCVGEELQVKPRDSSQMPRDGNNSFDHVPIHRTYILGICI